MKLDLAWLVAVAAMTAPIPQSVPTPPVASGLVLGRAIDGTTGRPLGGVTVSLVGAAPGGVPGPPTSSTRVMTASDGYFLFPNLARGSFGITATRPGYVSGAYGKRSPSGGSQPLDLLEGERRGGLTIALWKYATIGGTVVDEVGEPVIGVQVRVLRRTILGGRWQLSQTGNQPATDDRGLYRISSLMPGEYVAVVVFAPATVPTALQDAYTQAIAAGTVSTFSRSIDAAGGSIASRGGLRVGPLMLNAGGQAPGGSLAAGGPAVRPARGDGPLFIYPTVFYPGAPTLAGASVLSVASGEVRSNVNFQLRPVPSVRVSGTVVAPDGPSAHTGLQLLPAGGEGVSREYSFEAATTISDATGAFTFLGVTPGRYTIKVLRAPPRPVTNLGPSTVVQVGSSTISSFSGGAPPPPIPSDPTLWAAVPVSVAERDLSGLTIPLSPGARISGRIEFRGASARPSADRLRQTSITIDSSDGRSVGALGAFRIRQAQVDAEGRISSYQLPAGTYVLRPSPLPGWTFAGATLDGRDVSDRPFALGASDLTGIIVTFTDHPADLSGTVRDGTRTPDGSAAVLLFPADSGAWTDYGINARRLRSTSAGKDGIFRFAAVPDGDYFVIAMNEEATTNWQDPAMLRKLAAGATRITIGEGEKKVQDLTVTLVK